MAIHTAGEVQQQQSYFYLILTFLRNRSDIEYNGQTKPLTAIGLAPEILYYMCNFALLSTVSSNCLITIEQWYIQK